MYAQKTMIGAQDASARATCCVPKGVATGRWRQISISGVRMTNTWATKSSLIRCQYPCESSPVTKTYAWNKMSRQIRGNILVCVLVWPVYKGLRIQRERKLLCGTLTMRKYGASKRYGVRLCIIVVDCVRCFNFLVSRLTGIFFFVLKVSQA
jgi:hypothetical protein